MPVETGRRHPTRRELLILGTGAFLVSRLPVRGRPRAFRRTVPVMGTLADLVVLHDNPVIARSALEDGVRALQRVDALMTRFRADSDIGRLNRAVGSGVTITRETAWVLRRACVWAEATDGAFDPCLARLTALWDSGDPSPQSLAKANTGRRPHRDLQVTDTSARLANATAAVDLGGIAKGYGVDRAVAAIRAWGVTDGLVNAGGDLYAMGVSEDGDAWRVGVRSPTAPGGVVDAHLVRDGAVATSGDYLRPTHLLSAVTGRPVRPPFRSVTVRAVTCLDADAAATAVFAMGRVDAAMLDRAAPATRVLRLA